MENRSRLYIELKRQHLSLSSQVQDQQCNKQKTNSHQQFIVQSFLQHYDTRSLLLTKQNLIELVSLLHQENIALTDGSNVHIASANVSANEKQRQEQIDQLKLRKQLYEKQLKEKNKLITDLKIKVSACEEYLDQMNSQLKDRNNQLSTKQQNKLGGEQSIERDQLQYINKDDKDQPELNESQSQSVMQQLVKGFEMLGNRQSQPTSQSRQNDRNKKLASKIQTPPSTNKLSFLNTLKKPQLSAAQIQQQSSSLIQTSSFVADYYRSHQGSGLSSSIRAVLKFEDDEEDKEENIILEEQSMLETERKKGCVKKLSDKQSVGDLLEESDVEGRSDNNDTVRDQNDVKQQSLEEFKKTINQKNQNPFLSMLSKFKPVLK